MAELVEHPHCDWEVVGLIPGQFIPKTFKMVLAALLQFDLGTHCLPFNLIYFRHIS